MTERRELLKRLYGHFSDQDIEPVLAFVADNVVWANAMEGGHEHGREAVRSYWTRQMAAVRVRVVPVRFDEAGEEVTVTVEQTVLDVDGNPPTGQEQGLSDKTVRHVFRFRGNEIVRFDVQGA